MIRLWIFMRFFVRVCVRVCLISMTLHCNLLTAELALHNWFTRGSNDWMHDEQSMISRFVLLGTMKRFRIVSDYGYKIYECLLRMIVRYDPTASPRYTTERYEWLIYSWTNACRCCLQLKDLRDTIHWLFIIYRLQLKIPYKIVSWSFWWNDSSSTNPWRCWWVRKCRYNCSFPILRDWNLLYCTFGEDVNESKVRARLN